MSPDGFRWLGRSRERAKRWGTRLGETVDSIREGAGDFVSSAQVIGRGFCSSVDTAISLSLCMLEGMYLMMQGTWRRPKLLLKSSQPMMAVRSHRIHVEVSMEGA